MLTKQDLIEFLQNHYNKEFSKEELINRFSQDPSDEISIEKMLSEVEVEFTYLRKPLNATCKGGTVYFKWTHLDNTA
jgi:hypothetical protein